nr:hypothetical protein [Corynebacterium sp. UBA5992]
MGYFNLRPWKKAPELPAKTVEPEVPPTSILLRRAEEYQQMVADVLEAGASEDELPIAEPVANGVVEMWSIDRGDHFEHLSQRHLDQAGLSFEAARHSALEQLREAARGLRIEGGDGRFRVSYPDNPDLCASFILVADEWLDTSSLLGEAVYAVGTRTLLHVCGSEDAAAVGGMIQIAETFYEAGLSDPKNNGMPLTPRPLVMQDGVLADFTEE